METIYLGFVIFLFVLAIFDLMVGVSNDAVNFLNSAVGAKTASFKVIIIVAAIGVFMGATMSNGMMDIARHGIVLPEHYYMDEVMCIFLAVMITDVILLDIFNSLGLPTSTTVSMVFELLGAAFAMSMVKIANDVTGELSLLNLLNTEKALSVIIAIFVSVAIAFVFGTVIQFIARLFFSFNYKKGLGWKIGIFGGLAVTAIVYFLLINGVKGLTIINANTWTMCFYNNDNALMESNLLLGYRTYSDGLMMSECRDSVGRYNFVRTGDDAIEFKGTGWGGAAVGSNCLYEYNDCWTDKGSGYCLTWESACDMENMTFRNNSLGFAQPTWNTLNNALDCRLGTDVESRWGDVVFENIEIYHVISPNVIVTQMSGLGAILDNILFENITVKSTDFGVFAYTMTVSGNGTITNIQLKNYNFCGKVITSADMEDETLIKFEGGAKKTELTIS